MNEPAPKRISLTRQHVTLIGYGLILAAILAVAVYAASDVIFGPWLVRDWTTAA